MKNLFLLFVLTTFQFSLLAQHTSSDNSNSGNTNKLLAYNTTSNLSNNQTKTKHLIHSSSTSNISIQDNSCIENDNSENWEMITEFPENPSNLPLINNETDFTLDWPCAINH